jgi:5'-nucleotidase/UDP-sugar diphosphatase
VTHAVCFQTYGRGSGIGIVTLEIDDATHTLKGYHFPSDDGDLVTLFEEEFPRNDQEALAIDTVVARVETGMDTPIGSAAEAISRTGVLESPMGNLVADAMRDEVKGDFAFTNKGGVRSEFAAGPITPRDVFEIIPFENQLVVVNVNGEFLKKLMEEALRRRGSDLYISGGRLVVDPSAPEKQRIVSFEIGGKPLQPDKTYQVVTTDYLLQGNSGMQLLTTVSEANVNYTGVLMRSSLENYISKHSPIKPKIDGRWQEITKKGT